MSKLFLKKEIVIFTFLLAFAFFILFASAEEYPISENNSQGSQEIIVLSVNNSSAEGLENNTILNKNFSQEKKMTKISLLKIIPAEVKTGDIQLSLQLENIGNETLYNIILQITGSGFSVYETPYLEILHPGAKSYVPVFAHVKEEGKLNLSIKIMNDLFYTDLKVINPDNSDEKKKEMLLNAQEEQKKLQEQERKKQEFIKNVSSRLEKLKKDYSSLENNFSERKDKEYDVSSVNLEDAKKYLRTAESELLGGKVDESFVQISLAREELKDISSKLSSVKKVSSVSKIKDYAVVFSAIAGAILTFFALSELLKKKSQVVVSSVKDLTGKIVKPKK